jgi:hypothetical protein
MKSLIIAATAALALALGACTQAEEAKTKADVHDAASNVVEAGHKVAASPVTQKAGEDLKEAAHDTGTVLKDAAKGAVSGAKEGIAKTKGDHDEAGSTTTTTTTTRTVETKKN